MLVELFAVVPFVWFYKVSNERTGMLPYVGEESGPRVSVLTCKKSTVGHTLPFDVESRTRQHLGRWERCTSPQRRTCFFHRLVDMSPRISSSIVVSFLLPH